MQTKLMQHPELPDVITNAEIVDLWRDGERLVGWVLRFPGEAFDRYLTRDEVTQLQAWAGEERACPV